MLVDGIIGRNTLEAMNVPVEALNNVVDDPDPEVRDIAQQRLANENKSS